MDAGRGLTKHRRNQNLFKYKRDHPKTKNAAIGRVFHITRERVRVILRDHRYGR